MKTLITWSAKALLWVRLGWPVAVWFWSVFEDGVFSEDEAVEAIHKGWPKDTNGKSIPIEIPLMRNLRTK